MLDRAIMAESDSPELSGSESDEELMENGSDSEGEVEHAVLSRQNSAQPGQNILQCFWGLASVNDEERRTSAVTLLMHLRSAQESAGEKGVSSELDYTIRRLVRGLASSRQGARQGFSLVLTEVLELFPEVQLKTVMKTMEESMAVTGSMKGQEERDNYFGRVFGLASILQSGRLSGADADKELLEKIVGQLIELSGKKSYLREPAMQILASATEVLNEKVFRKAVLPALEPLFADPEWSAEVLALALATQNSYKELDYKALFSSWKKPHKLLHPSNFRRFQGIMMKTGDVNHPSLHVAWKYALPLVKKDALPAFWKQVVDKGLFVAGSHERKYTGLQIFEMLLERLPSEEISQLFTQNVIRTLLNNAGNENNYLQKASLHALQRIKEIGASDGAKAVVMVTQLLGPYGSHHFDRATKSDTVQSLIRSLGATDLERYIRFLMDSFSAPSADRLAGADAERNIHLYREWTADQLVALVKNPHVPKQEAWVTSIMRFLILHGFYRQRQMSQDSEAPAELTRAAPTPALMQATHDMCAQRAFSLLGELSSWSPALHGGVDNSDANGAMATKPHSHALDGTMEDGEFWVYRVHEFNRVLLDLEDGPDEDSMLRLVRPLDDDACQAYEDISDTIDKLRAQVCKKGASSKLRTNARAFELLCLHTSLLLFRDQAEFVEVLQDLKQCYAREFETKQSKTPKKKAEKKGDDDEEEEPEAIEVLTDVLLALLAKPSALLRSVCEHVFRIYCAQLTSGALDLILQVLMVDPTKGSEEVFETVEDGDEMDVDADDSDAEEGGHKHSHAAAEKGNASDSDESEKSEDDDADSADESEGEKSGDDESGADESDDDVLSDAEQQLKSKIFELMGDAAINMDAHDTDSEMSDLDDDQMMEFDAKLSEVFRNRKSFKAEKRDALKAILDFMLRTIDLLEIFVKKQPANPLVLEIIMPALDALRTVPKQDRYKVLQERLEGLIKNKLSKLRECPRSPVLDLAIPHEIMTELFKAAYKAPTRRHLDVIASCILLCIRVCAGSHYTDPSPLKTRNQRRKEHDEEASHPADPLGQLNQDLVKQLYGDALRDFLTNKKTSFHLGFFTEAFRRYPALGVLVIQPAVEAFKESSKPYAHTQAFALLEALIKLQGLSAQDVCDIAKSAQPYMESILKNAQGMGFNSKHLKAISKSTLVILNVISRSTKAEVGNALQAASMAEALRALAESPMAKQAPSISASAWQALRLIDSNAAGQAQKQRKLEKQKRKQEQPRPEKSTKDDAQAQRSSGKKRSGKKSQKTSKKQKTG